MVLDLNDPTLTLELTHRPASAEGAGAAGGGGGGAQGVSSTELDLLTQRAAALVLQPTTKVGA